MTSSPDWNTESLKMDRIKEGRILDGVRSVTDSTFVTGGDGAEGSSAEWEKIFLKAATKGGGREMVSLGMDEEDEDDPSTDSNDNLDLAM